MLSERLRTEIERVFGLDEEAFRDASERWTTLTPREGQVAGLIASGMKTAAIAQQLSTAPKTVDAHRARVVLKLRVPIIGIPRVYFALRTAGLLVDRLEPVTA